MRILSAPPGTLRFPDRCVECGAPPTRSFALALPRGADPRKLDAPLCARHGERKSLGQLGWIAGGALAGIAGMIALAAALDALMPAFPALRALVTPIVVALFALAGIPVWLAARRGRRSFHRRFSAVWVEGPAAGGAVSLGFRAEDLRREVAAASGLAAGAAAPFRTPGAPAPAFAPRGNPIPGWAIALFGLAILPAGVAEYVSLGKAELRGGSISRNALEIVVYRMLGREGVLVFFVLVGVLIFAAGVRSWRKAQERQE